jgi:hypothetical protein
LEVIGKAFSLWWQDWSNQEWSFGFSLLSLTVLVLRRAIRRLSSSVDLKHAFALELPAAGGFNGTQRSLLWGCSI